MILLAGDIGALRVIQELQRIAPVLAVHGNMDRGLLREQYPAARVLQLRDKNLLLVHRISDGLEVIARRREDGTQERIHVLVHGHTHRAECVRRDGMLHFNPGVGGLPRDYQVATVGRLTVDGGEVHGEVLRLGQVFSVGLRTLRGDRSERVGG